MSLSNYDASDSEAIAFIRQTNDYLIRHSGRFGIRAPAPTPDMYGTAELRGDFERAFPLRFEPPAEEPSRLSPLQTLSIVGAPALSVDITTKSSLAKASCAAANLPKRVRVRSMDEVILEQAMRRAQKKQSLYLPLLEVAGQNVNGFRRKSDAQKEKLTHLPRIEVPTERGAESDLDSPPPSEYQYSLYKLEPLAKSGDRHSDFADKRIKEILQSEGLKTLAGPVPIPVIGRPQGWSRRSLPGKLTPPSLDQLVLIPRRASVALQLAVLESEKKLKPQSSDKNFTFLRRQMA